MAGGYLRINNEEVVMVDTFIDQKRLNDLLRAINNGEFSLVSLDAKFSPGASAGQVDGSGRNTDNRLSQAEVDALFRGVSSDDDAIKNDQSHGARQPRIVSTAGDVIPPTVPASHLAHTKHTVAKAAGGYSPIGQKHILQATVVKDAKYAGLLAADSSKAATK